MHLSKLEIFGFKSFANKTVVNFTRGITGIVGPNGCGKTNIVDAIRWCLGEQKSSTLRSDKMENVIFNGTRNKKPMGMSEVSLTIVNDKGILPTDFSEITITRRIFRSGESEYLLNKNICRLKDITNLFMDTGMGTNAYSVIELKMIETILSNKADERRKMFEEAAGVNKYKLRRRLSLNKLDDVKKDLTRVNDIVSEVEKSVRSLERQAKKADRYNHIQTELRDKELGLAEREYFVFNRDLNRFESEFHTLNEQKDNIDNQIKETESLLMNFRHEISSTESVFREKSQEVSELNDRIYKIYNTIAVSEERKNSLNKNIVRFKDNITEYTDEKEEIAQNIINYREVISNLNNQIASEEEKLIQSKNYVDQKREELFNKRQEYKLLSEKYNSEQRDASSLENEINNHQNSVENSKIRITKLNNSIQQITSEIAKSVGYLEELENEKLQIETKLKESEIIYTKNAEIKENLENEISELRVKELEEKNHIVNIKDKIEFFQTLLNNMEGLSQGSRSLIESEGWTQKEKILLADIGSPKEKYRLAVETALRNVLNNIIIQSTQDLESAVVYLKKNDLGRASFLMKSSANGKNGLLGKINNFSLGRKTKKIQKEASFIDWVINLVETENRWKPYFESSLKNVVLVKTLKDGISLSRLYPEFDFVTLDGESITSAGVVEATSSEKLDDSVFGRRQLLENLKEEYPKLEVNLQKIREMIEEKEDESNKINLKNISDQGKILLNEANNIDKHISQIEFEKLKSDQDIEKIQKDIQETVSELKISEEKVYALNTDLGERKETLQKHKDELKSFEDNLNEEEKEYNNLQSDYNKNNIALERLKGEIQNKNSLLKKSFETENSLANTIERLSKEINSAHQEIEAISEMNEENQYHHDELSGEKNVLSDKLTEIEKELSEKKRESAEYEEKLNNIRNARQEISDKIHQIQVKQNEIKIRLENLIEHIKDEYNIDLGLKEFDDIEEYDFKLVNTEVHQLREKLKNLGPINLLAYSEYEEENERLEFLNQQRNDLIESEKDLIKTIKEINESAQTVFSETFESIRENFKKIFQTLFNPGDEADLILEDDVDPLEGKIEIVAKPKGKRPTGIELLSGGEKTLTATALLFAIYLVKPSPFCIMDEVDAPLDDANIDRFTRLLKEFSGNTQFIIVTHNKRTMEAAENMYGVTIQEEGVSKLVGVQFNEELGVLA